MVNVIIRPKRMNHALFKMEEILSYLLQIPQWCVLAGLGMMHFLQTDTNGLEFFSCTDRHALLSHHRFQKFFIQDQNIII